MSKNEKIYVNLILMFTKSDCFSEQHKQVDRLKRDFEQRKINNGNDDAAPDNEKRQRGEARER